MSAGIDADVIVVGGGLAGLVATAELVNAGRRVILLDQEPEASLGGQAFWSLGGLFLVDTPEQRRVRIHDSPELALQDWLGQRRLRPPRGRVAAQVGEAYVEFASGEKRQWLHDQGVRFVPDARLARARRLSRHRARELGAALPHRLGRRARAWSSRSSAACARASPGAS